MSAHRILDHVWRARPFCDAKRGFKKLERLDERANAFILKPSRATYRDIGAGRESKDYFYRREWRKPFANVSTNADNVC